LPRVPVCQPMTAIVGPTEPEPAYQPVNDESARTRPATQVTCSARAKAPAPAKRSVREATRPVDGRVGEGSGVSMAGSMGEFVRRLSSWPNQGGRNDTLCE